MIRILSLSLLIAALAATGCAATVANSPATSDSGDEPEWVNRQTNHGRCWTANGVLYAVGESNFTDPSIRYDIASLMARAELAKCLNGVRVDQATVRDGDSTTTTITERSGATFSGGLIEDRYVDPDTGIEYVLATLHAE